MSHTPLVTLSRRVCLGLIALCVLYGGFRYFQFVAKPKAQDFHIYYYSVLADQAGIDEYTVAGLKEVSDGVTKFLFVYPPHVLAVFKPFTWLSRDHATRLFLVLKTLAFVFLFKIWLSFLPKQNRTTDIALLLLLSCVGYYECTYTDFKNGNISVFEQALLWAGFYYFLRDRFYLFSILVLAASFFKLALIPMIGLLLLIPNRKGWSAFAFGSIAFFATHGLSYLYDPAEYMRFLGASTGLVETGPLNPSTMMFMRAIFNFAGNDIANAVYALVATAIALYFARLTWPSLRSKNMDRMFLIMGYCLMYTIVMPRFKNYSFVMLILPTYWVMQYYMPRMKWLFAALMVALVAHVFAYQTWSIAALMLFFWFSVAKTEGATTNLLSAAKPAPAR